MRQTGMRWLWKLFFPAFCGGCEWIGTYLCQKCLSEFVFLPPHYHEWWYVTPWCKVTAKSLVAYLPPASTLLHRMKYSFAIDLCTVISSLLFTHFSKPYDERCVVTSVPAHPHKKRQRGFDQSELIAKELAKWWQLPYVQLLERKESILSLADQKSKADRLCAAGSMFKLKDSVEIGKIETVKEIVVIDDVMTTGSTVRVCAQLLSQLGAHNISILTFARKL